MDVLTPKQRQRAMAAVKSRHTKPEMLVRRFLHGQGFRYRLHVTSLPGTPDIVFPTPRKIINVNGCFWHGHSCPKGAAPKSNREFWSRKIAANKARDTRVANELRALRWRVLTVWECELKDWALASEKLLKFLRTKKQSQKRRA